MAQSIRQTNLFLAEDWKVVYQSFQEVNFTSYDFDSIRSSMVEYIRRNYPEDFNDWIESSEFVAIIDLLAYLGQTLAFRMDLNTRENFLDTAESRDSILRLARMLSYTPQRNYPAFGLVKVVGVQTDEPVLDSENRNLSGINIEWNSTTNPDWLEQFTLVLNSAFTPTNQFGDAVKSGTVSNIPTELYSFNNVRGINVTFPFTINVSGLTHKCEIVNPDFTDLETIFESAPDPYAAMGLLYRNDTGGNSSANTGFFLPFKQGTLAFQDVELSIPIENRLLNIDIENINETDVWFQEIDADGRVTNDWEKVPTVAPSSNVIYNALDRLERDIFTVLTRDNDEISLRFADGRFGNIPQGIYRVWYRTSNGLSYSIRPQDIQNFRLTFPYQNVNGQTYNLTLTYSLQNTVSNSIPRETDNDIKIRAPQLYYTQDRMVNGEDYNVFPLVRSGNARKVKAVNRTFSGHSRYIYVNDPTGTTQNTNVFSNDGIFYKEEDTDIQEISINTSLSFGEIISTYIEPAISSTELLNFVRANGVIATNFNTSGSQALIWQTATQISGGSTGYFEQNGSARVVDTGAGDPYHYITENALINLVPVDDVDTDGIWVLVTNIDDDGAGLNANGTGKITIDERIDTDEYVVKQVVPSFSTTFSTDEEDDIEEQLRLKNTFGLGFDYVDKEWYIIEPQNLASADSTYSLDFAKNTSGANLDSSWLVRIEYTSTSWRFYTRGLVYVWESVRDVRFFYSNDYKAVNIQNGKAVQDEIEILETNSKPDSNDPLESALELQLDSTYIYPDGYIEPRRVKVTMRDNDADGSPDDPQIFEKVVGDGEFVFWERFTSIDGYEYLRPIDMQYIRTTTPTGGDPATPVNNDLAFVYDPNDKLVGTFFQYDSETDTWEDVSNTYTHNPYARKDLRFQWKHFAPRENRIDPAITNLIDIFVLTTQYNNDIRTWIATNGREENIPEEPTSDELRLTFTDLESYKTISDTIIWRPTRYKVLFGEQAQEEYKARFKVVKVPGTTVSDNEIKSRIITTINEFFEVDNWDFGETFYFTELAAFIHQRLASIVGSVVLVPLNEESAFGNLFQVKAETDEIFVSAAKVSDVDIVDNLTINNLRIGN